MIQMRDLNSDHASTLPDSNRGLKYSSCYTTNRLIFSFIFLTNSRHYVKPSHPAIPGMERFANTYLHSHYYRKPQQLTGPQNVALVLGLGPSAIDISIEISKLFNTVYLSHRGKRLQTELPHNVKEVIDEHCFISLFTLLLM